ncbi:hypothetical protein H072_471 [Dactylellina haptotyla CBS 200.50]|uniref:Obg domain-containing protein n=1 Tax=Dactylellina haptotyla (strain CBS 200.50) TaxID=1284197 RepID=S8ARG2_DACHA|nr:hypothetical protein H072_471 [Dactylellina haptotyla CBS 200.50]
MSTPLFLPFLYPAIPARTLSRILTRCRHSRPTIDRTNHTHHHHHRTHELQRRLKTSLTQAEARHLLDTELENIASPPPPPTHLTTDHRIPSFLDTLTLTLTSGGGGNGCVSFLREKFVSHGPPNGGDGGDGGDVYITIDEQAGSLHKLSRLRVVKAGRGSNGLGGARNGARGEDVVVKVPRGTVVRVLERGIDGKMGMQGMREEEEDDDDEGGMGNYNNGNNEEYGSEEGGYEGEEGEDGGLIVKNAHDGRTDTDPMEILEKKKKRKKRVPRRFARSNVDDPESEYIHYPLSLASNLDSPHWPPRKPVRRGVEQPDVFKLDFSDGPEPQKQQQQSEIYDEGGEGGGYTKERKRRMEPILLLKGGAGGYGNPNFITKEVRRPMWATKGARGSTMKIRLELKLLADVGLVGRPNVGKSSLLRCVTGSRAQVGNWAFTTLKPNMGTVILDGGLGTGDVLSGYEDQEAGRERFTIADIPGLVKDAGENRGLGWDFLRHVERARGLVFVVDLGFDPVRQVEGLWRDIEEYEKMREVERREAAEEERRLREEEKWRREAEEEDHGIIVKLTEEEDAGQLVVEEGISAKPWMVVGNKADLEGAERRFMKLREYLNKLEEQGKVKQPIGCIAVSALKAGRWTEGEYEKEAGVWRGVIQWFRSLVN